MRHYCTYFDAGFLPQGLTLAESLARHDPQSVLWVLALDELAADVMGRHGGPGVRVVRLAELEQADPALEAVKPTRSRVEYYFTLSPCLPWFLLQRQPEIDAIIYLDADLYFFSSPEPVWAALGRGSIYLCAHDFPGFLRHYERHGRFNVGVLGWRNDSAGRDCLQWWRERCLEWCYDRLEATRYADQKYLEEWPRRFRGVIKNDHPGINLAPWNWMNHRYRIEGHDVLVDERPLVVFHFARLRRIAGKWWWQSGHLDYGVMPWRLRQAVYAPYVDAIVRFSSELETEPAWQNRPQRPLRLGRSFWGSLPLRLLFGSDWLRAGGCLISGRLGLGRYSGRFLARLRRIFFRR